MAASTVRPKPPKQDKRSSDAPEGDPRAEENTGERYRPLPTGTHGLDPETVKRDQRERLQQALIELIAQKGYPAVRIADLAKLAHVSQPTFYRLYADKEELFLSAYNEIAQRTGGNVLEIYGTTGHRGERALAGMRAFAEQAMTEPEATSLLVLGAYGAGAKALERRRLSLEKLEAAIHVGRDGDEERDTGDLTVKAILGGVREVTATRLREGRVSELPELAEEFARWAAYYPRRLPDGLAAPPPGQTGASKGCNAPASERARRAEGRLPSGRSDLPRQFIVKSQRERIVDATAAIVAEKGLAALTIPEIAKRANVSNQTFYSIYGSKHEAFLGAQKVGMHQALQTTIRVYEAHKDSWPCAVAAGLRALIDYLCSEPAHAHLTIVDTFAASPEALDIRNSALQAFAAYLGPGYDLVGEGMSLPPPIVAEAIAGGIWQVLHHYTECDRVAELRGAAPQIIYFALTPFLGPERAAEAALHQEESQTESA